MSNDGLRDRQMDAYRFVSDYCRPCDVQPPEEHDEEDDTDGD